QADGSVIARMDEAQHGVETSGNGGVVLRTLQGSLTLLSGSDAVRAHGSGNVLLEAGGTGSDLVMQAGVSSGSGHVSVKAGRRVIWSAGVAVPTGGSGTGQVMAQSGQVTMADTSRLSSGTGAISVRAAGTVTVGGIRTGGNVSIQAGGAILDGGDQDVDVEA